MLKTRLKKGPMVCLAKQWLLPGKITHRITYKNLGPIQ